MFLLVFQRRDDRVQQERRDHDAKRLPDDPLQNHRHEEVHAARGARQVSLMYNVSHPLAQLGFVIFFFVSSKDLLGQ